MGKDGSVFEGQWKNDEVDGMGCFKDPSGKVTWGKWEKGEFVEEVDPP